MGKIAKIFEEEIITIKKNIIDSIKDLIIVKQLDSEVCVFDESHFIDSVNFVTLMCLCIYKKEKHNKLDNYKLNELEIENLLWLIEQIEENKYTIM